MKILMIDSGGAMATLLADRLDEAGFHPARHVSVLAALHAPVADDVAALVVLAEPDIAESCLAEPAGLVRRIRAAGVAQPLMVLTSRCDWRQRVETLDAGADDFLVMPYRSEEVAARLRAMIRRAAGASATRIRVGDFECDLKARRIWLNEEALDLTRNEQRLLQGFLLRSDFVLSRDQIAGMLYHDDLASRSDNAVEVYISRLRRKISHERIRTIRGLGYHVQVSEPRQAA
jgi:two-component system OmpR family response regulator